ncbi:hypothetical protein QNO07_09990 [Streptomyces sp. 549]|uniref:hypothetical protein n=1 Tax=Streptomyces sp. 549 TaxID=3049076 RepID=UPI0024C39AEF|nr:hypothetical protein [Streptomyces sp. 549]MDK1473747.1 hypothetical protein [Streptomyces sp. 549]
MRTFATGRYFDRRSFAALAFLLATILTAAQSSPAQAAAMKKVCAPKKCVKVKKSRICYPGDGCGKRAYRELPATTYCSSSVGCVSYKGKKYRFVGGTKMTPEQQTQAQKCAAGLGVAGLGFIGAGPTGVTILGVVVSAWGCS